MYEFEVEGNIVGKQRPRVNMYTGNVYTPNRTKDYEEWIKQSFFLKYPKFEILENRVSIEIIAYLKIPKNTSKVKTNEMLENKISPLKKPDIDNIGKIVYKNWRILENKICNIKICVVNWECKQL